MTKYADFLRHIVNPILSKYVNTRRSLVHIIDEIRKLLIDAEEKYGFSVFGGNPEKLVDYLKSNNFRILYRLFSSSNNLDILEEILVITREKYSNLLELTDTINELLSRIKEEREGISE